MWTFLVLFSVVWFYGLASHLVDTLSISSKPLDSIVADGSIFRYKINYVNNGDDTVGNTQLSLYTPRGLHFLTWSVPYDSVQANVDAYKLWVPGDVCYEQFLNETGIYAELLDKWALGKYHMTAYNLLFLMPYTPSFSSAPYNGERSMLGEYFVEVILPSLPKEKSFQDFISKTFEVEDFNTLTWCGAWLKTKYTRGIWSLAAGAWGDITVVLQADNPRRDDIISLDTVEWTHTDTPMNLSLPTDVNTSDYPVSVSYTNATDGWVSFWPNNPDYPATYSNASMVSWLLTDSMSPQEKALTLWKFVKDTTFNYPFVSDHAWYAVDRFEDWSAFTNPVFFLNSLYGMCGEINWTLARLAQAAWFESHVVSLRGHVVAEIKVDGQWGMLDADGGVYWTGDDGHIYSVAELGADTWIIMNNPQDNNYNVDWDQSNYAWMMEQWGNILEWDPFSPDMMNYQLFAFLQPNDTITYGYRFFKDVDVSHSNNGHLDDGIGFLTSRIASSVYTTVSGQEFGITGQTETWFLYANELPYYVTSLDISLDNPTDKNVQVSLSRNNGQDRAIIWKLSQRLTYDVANLYSYMLKFTCSGCAGNDIDDIISQLQIKNNFIFNTHILPYSWALHIYDAFLSDNGGTGIMVSFNKNIDSPVRFSVNITWDSQESVLLNNAQSIDILPLQDYAPALLPSDSAYATNVLEWKWYTSGATSLFDDLPVWTLVGTSALSFLNTDIIPNNIIIRSDDVEAFLSADTIVTPSWTACSASTLLAPVDMTDDYTWGDFSGVVKAFKIGSPCTGTTLNFSPSVTMRIHTDEVLSGTVIVRISSDGETDRQDITGTKIDDHTVEITTNHFSYFTIATLGTWSNEWTWDNWTWDNEWTWNNNTTWPVTYPQWNPTITKDICPNGDFSSSFYDGICTGTWPTQTSSGSQSCTAYSNELNAAYGFAWKNGITTISDCKQADLNGKLLRSHMAKMMSEYAMNVLKKVPDPTKTCLFVDMDNQSNEMQTYAILACQLWLMWYESDGQTQSSMFNPSQIVDRAQFGTILSRLLRWDTHNGWETYYQNHLQALQQAWIMTKIDAPFARELRWRVMLMMQRIFEKESS